MKYRDSWDLTTIPDEVLMREYGRRVGSRRAKKDTDDPEERKRLDKQADYMRNYRKRKHGH